MEKTPKLLMLLTFAEEISSMLEDGRSSIEVQEFLKTKGCQVSNKHLRINLKKLFPQYVVNGRWDPMRKRCEKELVEYLKNQNETKEHGGYSAHEGGIVESPELDRQEIADSPIRRQGSDETGICESGDDPVVSGDTTSREHPNDADIDAEKSIISSAFSDSETVVLATLASGVAIESDIKGHIQDEHYRLISEVYPHVPNSDNAIRSVLSQSVFGRDYLRKKHEALEETKSKEQ